MVERVTDNDEVVGPIPTTRTETKWTGLRQSISRGARRSHVFAAAKTGEPGSRNFASDGEQNIRDHKALVRGGAMFREYAKPRAGIAEFDGEQNICDHRKTIQLSTHSVVSVN